MGAVAAVSIRGMDNNVYTQIGIVLIIALASKNSILIVEFARELRSRGIPIRQAAANAARMRFRPILMTSFAFILGVVPLMVAHGAGAAGQQALGTAVFGGMLASTILAVFFVPAFFVVLQSIGEWWGHGRPVQQSAQITSEHLLSYVPIDYRSSQRFSRNRDYASCDLQRPRQIVPIAPVVTRVVATTGGIATIARQGAGVSKTLDFRDISAQLLGIPSYVSQVRVLRELNSVAMSL